MIKTIRDIIIILFLTSLTVLIIIVASQIGNKDPNIAHTFSNRFPEILENIHEEGYFKKDINYEDPVLNDRKIFIISDLDEKHAEEVVLKLAYLDKKMPGTPIDLYIETAGGRGSGILASYIQTLKSPVNTYALDWCQSAGAFLLASGTGKRYAFSNSRIIVHAVGLRSEVYDNEDKKYNYNKQLLHVEAKFWKRVTKKVPEAFYTKKESTYFHLTPEEALEMGIIDEVLEYRRNINTTIEKQK